MPQTIKNCFYKNLTFEKLLAAHYRARKHKVNKSEIISFELDLERNITNLLSNIKNGTYKIGTYRTFIIYEPKERIIKALPYVDRIVHQWYVEEFIKPYIVPKFFKTSFACIENRGTHKAVETLQKQMREYGKSNKNYWILKCDISKFFYSINPNILYKIMQQYISDRALLKFTKFLIYSDSKSLIGIPIRELLFSILR